MLGRTKPRTKARLIELLNIGDSLDAREFRRALNRLTERQVRYLIRKIEEVRQ